jgi:hydroxymethylbilane synthase
LTWMKKRFIVGTRTSQLAMWQTGRVIELLEAAWHALECETRTFTTRGDETLDKPLPQIGGKGLFTQELEDALRHGEIDAAVHSLKDLPVEEAPGLTVGAIAARADAGDCLVARNGWTLESLPRGAVVGTSSIRRQAQLLAARPDLEVRSIRGNVETRVRKVTEGQYDAAVLARAGLERLGLDDHVTDRFDPGVMLPAPGQGALAVQCRGDDDDTLELLSAIEEPALRAVVTAERKFLEGLGGGCSAPVGAYARTKEQSPPWSIDIDAVVGSPDGSRMIRVKKRGDDPARLGAEAAREAIDRGAGELLAEVKAADGERLWGKRVVVTRSREQSMEFCDKLSAVGARPVMIPAIRIVPVEDESPIDAALTAFPEYNWVVFTSVNGVEMFWKYLARRESGSAVFDRVNVAAVGTATARGLRDRGVAPEFVPQNFVASEIAAELHDVTGKRICLLRAEVAGRELPEILRSRGAIVDEVAVYRNVPADIDGEALAELERGVDIVTLTSGSTARNFVAALKNAAGLERLLVDLRFACIGPVTAEAARELNLDVAVVAEVHTSDGLLDALVTYFDKENRQ